MGPVPSDTFFTKAPHWEWLVILYFFFGGIAAGCFVFASILDLFGAPGDRRMARLGHFVALPALAVCPPLLILDLGRPLRFWHMLIMNNHPPMPIFKHWSPMSVGSWALVVFGIFVTIGFLGALGEVSASPFVRRFAVLGRGTIRTVNAILGGVFGFIVAGYTGVLLTATNRVIWADTPMLGALFLLSAATTSAAVLVWLGHRRADAGSVAWLARVEGWVAILEVVAIVVTVLTLGPVAKVWASGWGLGLVVVVVLGLFAPMVLRWRPTLLGASNVAVAALLAISSGLLLRAVVILSSEAA